jgi:hypothetical protein
MNNLDQWIDPRIKLVKAASIHAYLIAHGWTLSPSPRSQVLIFQEPGNLKGERVLQSVPAHDSLSDSNDAIVRVVTNLAAVEGRSAVEVLNDILKQSISVSSNGSNQQVNQSRIRNPS